MIEIKLLKTTRLTLIIFKIAEFYILVILSINGCDLSNIVVVEQLTMIGKLSFNSVSAFTNIKRPVFLEITSGGGIEML